MLPCLGREWSGLWSGAGPLLGGNSGSDRRLLDSPALSDRLDRWEDRGRLLLILALRRSGISENRNSVVTHCVNPINYCREVSFSKEIKTISDLGTALRRS